MESSHKLIKKINYKFFCPNMIEDSNACIDSNIGITKINAIIFKSMLIESVSQLNKQQKYLNHINVFPVQDGDTGSNMLHTMIGVKNSVEILSDNSLETICREVIKAILQNARGNSGIILSEYFKGFIAEIQNANAITSDELVRALVHGSKNAKESLKRPINGTMLDVFFAAAEGAEAAYKDTKDIYKILEGALIYAQIALEKTREILPQMKKAQVVDAGGAGFLFILEGFRICLKGENGISFENFTFKPIELQEEKLRFSYCVEAVLRVPAENESSQEDLRQEIECLGDSIHIVNNNDILKLHIHTNKPDLVKKACLDIGQVDDWKVDNMEVNQKQYLKSLQDPEKITDIRGSTGIKSMDEDRIAVVTDLSSDLPVDWLRKYPIFVVNMSVTLSGYPIDLIKNISLKEFYHRMATEKGFLPLTSQPNVMQFIETYKKALDIADTVICLPISSGLSGAYNNAVQAKIKLGSDSVYVIDSHSASLGLAILVKSIFNFQREGRCNLDMLIKLYTIRDRMEQYLVVDNIRYLARSGRLSREVSFLSKILHIHPLLQLKGGIIRDTGKRAYFSNPKKQIMLLAQQIEENISIIETNYIYIVHADAEDRAVQLKEYLKKKLGLSEGSIEVAEFGMILGAHVGPGTIAVIWV